MSFLIIVHIKAMDTVKTTEALIYTKSFESCSCQPKKGDYMP
jgi:hypothetical protein